MNWRSCSFLGILSRILRPMTWIWIKIFSTALKNWCNPLWWTSLKSLLVKKISANLQSGMPKKWHTWRIIILRDSPETIQLCIDPGQAIWPKSIKLESDEIPLLKNLLKDLFRFIDHNHQDLSLWSQTWKRWFFKTQFFGFRNWVLDLRYSTDFSSQSNLPRKTKLLRYRRILVAGDQRGTNCQRDFT